MTVIQLLDKLNTEKHLSVSEFEQIFAEYTNEDLEYACALARSIAVSTFGKKVYFRGIVEFTNICKNDCLYCGIRRSNTDVCRYRMSNQDILECCSDGYSLGYRTFVLQGGEDGHFSCDELCNIVASIRAKFPDCAITLSVGERSREDYERLFKAGANRYLLRHETADPEHYSKLHPKELQLENRIKCLNDLKEIGYQTGCGMMIGSPYQTPLNLAKDLDFIRRFQPHMVGIGPFIPHKDTPFHDFPAGKLETTFMAVALCRIMIPNLLLPATTALGTLAPDGRKHGVLAGCNVIMPNLSPLSVRKKYMLYDNKVGTEDDAAAGVRMLKKQMDEIGYEVVVGRGDHADISKRR